MEKQVHPIDIQVGARDRQGGDQVRDQFFRLDIQVRRAFVQDQDPRLAVEGAREQNALFLPS